MAPVEFTENRVTVSPLAPGDRLRWNELWKQYQEFYSVIIPAAASDATWTKIQSGRIRGFGARVPGEGLVGIVHCLFHEDTWSLAPACYLQDLYVAPTQRGGGYGRLLVETVAAAAKEAGASAPYWLTHETNVAARRLYDRLGRNQGFIHYAYVDARA